jgi:hypothetical protein
MRCKFSESQAFPCKLSATYGIHYLAAGSFSQKPKFSMILLCIDAGILIIITISLGILFQLGLEKFFRVAIRSDLPGIFLAGLIVSTVYFNLVSFCFPVNSWTLLPLAAISLLVFIRFRERYRALFFSMGVQRNATQGWVLPLLCLALLLFIYGIKPPTNPDSANYHFLSILWGEKYKVVPGLANLYEPYAYNPASFIIQSAYSFTGLAGRSLYPLNEVLSSLFLFWILARVYTYRNSLAGLVYFLFLVVSYRYLLGNLSSPSSDQLFQICLSYSLLRIFEILLSGEIVFSNLLLPCIILLYAPAAKMSAYPALLPLLFVFYLLQKKETGFRLHLVLASIAILIYLPWIGRNYIMSGYLAFPYPYLSPFHPDWKVPMNIMTEGYVLIHNLPRMLPDDHATLASQRSIAFSDWFFPLIRRQFTNHLFFELSILAAALASPLLWILLRIRNRSFPAPVFIFWLLLYSCCWLWLVNAPDYRYGVSFLTLCTLVPVLVLAGRPEQPAKKDRVLQRLLSVLFLLTTVYYLYGAASLYRRYTTKRMEPLGWKDGWLFPLRDAHYKPADSKDSFPYRILNAGTRLYLADRAHRCINTGIVCAYYGNQVQVEMRGERVEDGFRPTTPNGAGR